MNSRERRICEWLLERPGYMKCSVLKIAKASLLNGTPEEFENALKMAKNDLKKDSDKQKEPIFKRLYFDIETSYNKVASFVIGQKVNLGYENILEERAIICVSYKWAHEDKVYTITWDKGDDKQLLTKFMSIINSAHEVIGHNSDNYDIKWLRTRCLYHNIPMFPDYVSTDTLKLSRSKFRFNSNRLDYLGQYFGFGGKLDTGGLKLWKAIVEYNDKESLKKMVEYCEQDVLLLEKVFNKLNPYVGSKTHVGVILYDNKAACPNCGSTHSHSKGYVIMASGTKKMIRHCQGCGKMYRISPKLLEKK